MSPYFLCKRYAFILMVSLVFMGCAHVPLKEYQGQALIVTHSPNPTNINESEYFPEPPYQYMWFYRTEVTNNSDRDLKVIWFEGYFDHDGYWYGANILNRTLRGDIFMKWYGHDIDTLADDEWIKPGESRVCVVNWHADNEPSGKRVKLAYIAVDRSGNDYYAESIIESIPIKPRREDSSL